MCGRIGVESLLQEGVQGSGRAQSFALVGLLRLKVEIRGDLRFSAQVAGSVTCGISGLNPEP